MRFLRPAVGELHAAPVKSVAFDLRASRTSSGHRSPAGPQCLLFGSPSSLASRCTESCDPSTSPCGGCALHLCRWRANLRERVVERNQKTARRKRAANYSQYVKLQRGRRALRRATISRRTAQASRADIGIRAAVLPVNPLQVRIRTPTARAAAATSESIRCGRPTAARRACRGRTPG